MTLFLLEAFALLTNTSNRGGGEDQGNKNQIQPLFKVVQTTQVHSSNLPPSPPPPSSAFLGTNSTKASRWVCIYARGLYVHTSTYAAALSRVANYLGAFSLCIAKFRGNFGESPYKDDFLLQEMLSGNSFLSTCLL